MVFSSTSFLFLFLPLFLLAYVLLPWRNATALVFSLLFYAWGEGAYLLVMLGAIGFNYVIGQLLSGRRPAALVVGVAGNLVLLGWFKYFGFLAANVFGLELPAEDIPHLPLGISFFIFQCISYLVDVWRGDSRPARSLTDLALYVAMFPQLVAGPIVRYSQVAEALRERSITLANVRSGITLFTMGLCNKVLIANNVAEVADAAWAVPAAALDVATAWVGVSAYTLQIYFDFSGYSLMAIGLGRVMGFEFPVNFNYPYIATSVTGFWRRWHMSLSSWFRDYLYIPLGGNRKGAIRTYVNLVIVFFLCGLWHGAAWTFVAWGLFHGGLLVIERAGLGRLLGRLPQPLAIAWTLLMVMIGWVLFRSETFGEAWHFLTVMFTGGELPARSLAELLDHENALFGLWGVLISAPIVPWLVARLGKATAVRALPAALRRLSLATCLTALLAVCAMYVLASTYNPFIYFRF